MVKKLTCKKCLAERNKTPGKNNVWQKKLSDKIAHAILFSVKQMSCRNEKNFVGGSWQVA